MKFIKGIMIGTIVSIGAVMMYTEATSLNKNKVMKKAKKVIKQMGM